MILLYVYWVATLKGFYDLYNPARSPVEAPRETDDGEGEDIFAIRTSKTRSRTAARISPSRANVRDRNGNAEDRS